MLRTIVSGIKSDRRGWQTDFYRRGLCGQRMIGIGLERPARKRPAMKRRTDCRAGLALF
jgi:hypothetical protein